MVESLFVWLSTAYLSNIASPLSARLCRHPFSSFRPTSFPLSAALPLKRYGAFFPIHSYNPYRKGVSLVVQCTSKQTKKKYQRPRPEFRGRVVRMYSYTCRHAIIMTDKNAKNDVTNRNDRIPPIRKPMHQFQYQTPSQRMQERFPPKTPLPVNAWNIGKLVSFC